MPPKRKVAKCPPAREAIEQPTQNVDEGHGLLQVLQILITWGGEPKERGRTY